MNSNSDFGRLWSNHSYRTFLSANVISSVGSTMSPIALAFAVLELGGGPASLGIVLAASSLPTIVLLVLGGALADRLPRRQILVGSNVLLAVIQAGVCALIASKADSVTLLAAAALVTGAVAAFSGPASQGIVRQLVPPADLQKANAVSRLPTNVLKVAGPALGGLLVAASTPAIAIGIDAATFVLSAILLSRLPRLQSPVVRTTVVADIRSGWSEFRARTWLWTFTLFGTLIVALWLAGFQLLGPVTARQAYDGATSWGLISGSLALGLLCGTFISLHWKPTKLLAVSIAGNVGLAFPLVALALHAPILVVLACTLVAGLMLDIAIVCWVTVTQLHMGDHTIGRLTAFNSLGERAATPLSYLVVGLNAAVFSPELVLLICAAGIVLCTGLNLAIPSVYQINREEPAI